jgi:polyketide biosynthesis enoyl-CoA hydratase PksI
MELPKIQVVPIDDYVASLRISTDDQPYIEEGFAPALADAVAELKRDEQWRAVIVEGGPRYFSAGASIDSLTRSDGKSGVPTYAAELPRLMLSIPVPTIAAMAGHAIGGGWVLGLWCDVAFLAEESMYGANFMALGFTPGMGATMIVEEWVGAPLARELLFTGRLVKGRELKYAGSPLAHAILPRAEVRERALAVAAEIAQVPRESLRLLKSALTEQRRERLERVLRAEQAMHQTVFSQPTTAQQIAERYAASPF